MAAEFRPDVVMMDIGMPKMNGYEAARHIRQQPWGEKMMLVALTGWAGGRQAANQRGGLRLETFAFFHGSLGFCVIEADIPFRW